MNTSRKVLLGWLIASVLVTLFLSATMNAFAWQGNEARTLPVAANSPAATVPGWQQSNVSGFGTVSNTMVSALQVFNNQMYATTWNDSGSQVWRTSDGKSWSQFTPGTPFTTTDVYDAIPFGTNLYIGTYLDTGGEIWRTNGTSWERVVTGGLGDANNLTFSAFAVYSNTLYVATGNLTTGVEIWSSPTGNSGSWTQVNTDGFGGGVCWDSITMDTFGGYLYVGIGRNTAELWRTNNGITWTPVFTDGLGNTNNTYVSAMAEYKGHFYIGLRNTVTSGQIWGTTNGTTFNPITTNGFYNPNNSRPYGLYVHDNILYIVFSNYATGAEVWRTDGLGWWRRILQGGWGDANNKNADYFDKAAVSFNNSLYIGAGNDVVGGQVWQMLRQLYLPLIMR